MYLCWKWYDITWLWWVIPFMSLDCLSDSLAWRKEKLQRWKPQKFEGKRHGLLYVAQILDPSGKGSTERHCISYKYPLLPDASWTFHVFQKPIKNTVGLCSEGRLCTNMVTQCYTYANWAVTAELSPPRAGSPQVTTDPSARIAANAQWMLLEAAGHP